MLFVQLLVVQILIFAGLILLLRYLLTNNVIRATSHLEQQSQDFARKQQQATKRLQEAEQEYQNRLTQAQQEVIRLKEKTEQDAQLAREKTLQDARQESERIIERANKTGEILVDEQQQKIEVQAIERAQEIIQQVLPGHLHKEMHLRWVEELISAGLEELGSLQVSENITEAEAKTAFALSNTEKQALQKKLEEKLGREVKLKEDLDRQLVAGVVIKLGSLVLDGSLRYKIKEAARAREKQTKEQ
ncbi:F0F1 ATP synthase subunit delta [Candidatus Omnitrophota bacterium]